MRRLLWTCLLASSLLRAERLLQTSDLAAGWISLFDGRTTFGWSTRGAALWHLSNNQLTADSPDAGAIRNSSSFGDFTLSFDFETTGSGTVYLRVPPGQSLENGADFNLAGSGGASSWKHAEITAVGDELSFTIDGNVISAGKKSKYRAGQIAFGNTAGGLSLRDINLKPAGLDQLYNGSNLDGWKLTDKKLPTNQKEHKLLKVLPLPESKAKPSQADWSIRDGFIHVEHGPGQLETQRMFSDFLLQFEARTNPKSGNHPEAAIILRGAPGEFASGYRVQVDNEFRKSDRSQPANQGTGGLISFQPARRVLPSDGELFYETIVASGRHIAVWVNGFQVTDFEDRRPIGTNLAREARTGQGTIALEATRDTNIDLRGIRIAPLVFSEPTKPVVADAPKPPQPEPSTPPANNSGQANASAVLAQQIAEQQSQQQQAQLQEQQKQNKVSALMRRALNESSPERQVPIYDQILAIDPTNQVAFNGRGEAQDKIEKAQQERAQSDQKKSEQDRQAAANETTRQNALRQAESELLRGNLNASRADAEIARRLAPHDPEVARIFNLIDNRLRIRSWLMYALFGTSGLGLIGLVAYLLRRRRRPRQPYLEVIDGLDKGKGFQLKGEITRLGAVPRDGGVSNDVVLTDIERSISRFHCEIHNVHGKLYILDCGSSNGTFLDGKRLPPEQAVLLKPGARIQLARAACVKLDYRKQT